jgi:hypothetical protein
MNGHESRGTRVTVTISNQIAIAQRGRERRSAVRLSELPGDARHQSVMCDRAE